MITGLHTGSVRFTVESHDEPPPDDDRWEDAVEVSFTPASSRIVPAQSAGEATWPLDLAETRRGAPAIGICSSSGPRRWLPTASSGWGARSPPTGTTSRGASCPPGVGADRGRHDLAGRASTARPRRKWIRSPAVPGPAAFVLELRGLGDQLAGFPNERSEVTAALIYCDLTTGPTGAPMSLDERIGEVLGRYGSESVVARAMRLARPELAEAVDRVGRLVSEGDTPTAR